MSATAREREVIAKSEASHDQMIAKLRDNLEPYRDKHKGQEVLILGNGPSLLRHDLARVPASVVTMGLNQSWRVFDNPTYHLACDDSQYKHLGLWRDEKATSELPWVNPKDLPKIKHVGGAQSWFNEAAAKGKLFCTSVWPIGIHLPFSNPHRLGPEKFSPDVAVHGLVISWAGCGSVLYAALQLCEFMGFGRIWIVGMDQTDRKFTGQAARAHEQDRLFTHTPARVKDIVRVIAPSATKVFQIEGWPWST